MNNKNDPTGAIEGLAAQVEAHPDYRVLRRLDTSVEYPPLSSSGVSRAVLLDTETTGMDPAADRIVELALVVFEYDRESGAVGRVLAAYNGLEDPGMPIPPESTAVHGITDAMVAGQRLDETAIARLMEGVAVVIAHNAGFDRKFVEARLPAFAGLPWACSFREIPWDAVGIGSAKLDYLAYQNGFFYDGHRAEVDCRALLEILRRPLGSVWGEKTDGPSTLGASRPEPRGSAAVGRGEASDGPMTALKALLDRAREPTYRVWARGSNFDTKDVLKARQYRWDAEERCWWIESGAEELEAELAWLKTAVYGGKPAVIELEVLDARVRHSSRSGKWDKRAL